MGEMPMDLSIYNEKHVRVQDRYGNVHTGMVHYFNSDYLMHEYGADEDGIMIENFLILHSQISSLEEIRIHGTAELWTGQMMLRRYRPEDAEDLYQYLGKDPAMSAYSGWNPYATPEMAQETVLGFIQSYSDPHAYSWVMDIDDVIVGTIGAYDLKDSQIEVGFSVVRGWQGRGLATAALKTVLAYLTENEGISCVTAWCAQENIASRKVLEKAGMKLTQEEKGGLTVGDSVYDKLIFAYQAHEKGIL